MCLCSLFACGNAKLKLYEVYVCESSDTFLTDLATGDVIYNEARQIYSLPKTQTSVKINMDDEEIFLGSERISLQYQNTYCKEFCEYEVHSYQNTEYGIRAQYRVDNGSLEYLRLGDYAYSISDRAIQTEKDLVSICNNYVLQHIENIEKYDVQIETKIKIVDENGENNQLQPGFVASSGYKNQMITYTVDYIYEIDGLRTAENIKIVIDSEGFLKTASFHMIGAFEEFKDVKIDKAHCDELIASEVSAMCTIEEYSYSGYSDSKILLIFDDKLCVFSYIQPNFQVEENTNDFIAAEIQMLIPVAK